MASSSSPRLPKTALEITTGLHVLESIVGMTALFNSQLILLSRKPLLASVKPNFFVDTLTFLVIP